MAVFFVLVRIIAWLLLGILLATLILLLLVLLIPFDYLLQALIRNHASFTIQIRWAILGVDLLTGSGQPAYQVSLGTKVIKSGLIKSQPVKKTEKKRAKRPAARFGRPGRAFFNAVLAFINDLFKSIMPRTFKASGIYSLDDPADTAGVSCLIVLLQVLLPGAQIDLQPSFADQATDVEMVTAGRIVLIRLVWLGLKYLLKKEIRRVIFPQRQKKSIPQAINQG